MIDIGKAKHENKYIIYEDYAELIIISDTYGKFKFKIDLEDVEKCQLYHWSINRFGHNKDIFYAVNRNAGLLHRYILNETSKKQIDHISGDTLDTRKENLRVVEQKDNLKNKGRYTVNKSGYTGVYWCGHLYTPKWHAYITINKKRKNLGYYDDLKEAIQARKEAEKEFGEFRRRDV